MNGTEEQNTEVQSHGAVRLDASQKDRAAAVLARAFRDDPIQRYVIPDDDRRARVAPWTFGAAIRYCLPHGGVYAALAIGGVACWLPPGVGAADALGMIRSGKISAPLRLGPAAFLRFMGIASYMTAERKRLVPAPHWYLLAIGVEPSRQGEGMGGALLESVLSLADADGTSCYLETQTKRNVKFYERHGFAVTSVGEPRGLRVWTMLRKPRPTATAGETAGKSIRSQRNNDAKEER